ncbi:Uncharacterised protein [Rhodococcus gordoniae]|uniref:Uncharacterized protein n=1 Tax=Rhodococcus gordoniae TaxID=223392 RepID=A0A379M3S6_9NOCA|nr:Uncharacterised protein [Rhodococcus gordoniae]
MGLRGSGSAARTHPLSAAPNFFTSGLHAAFDDGMQAVEWNFAGQGPDDGETKAVTRT